jgi:small subunit ribosomal protein S7
MMYDGKKSASETICYEALDIIKKKTSADPLKFFHDALNNVKPGIEVRSRRVGGATYQVPIEISFERQESLALRWIVDAAGSRKGLPMKDALAAEIIDAYNNTGSVVKKKEDTHKMAQANRAFAHLRW